ncbi:MAG TPA: trypsin-like peptidase domain-containing protein [Bacillota bacterium]|nr:trypsin-like peptidase domain-containing protein [Bacillota bacterium]
MKKKGLIFILLVTLVFVFAGCDFFSISSTTTTERTFLTSSTTNTNTTTTTIDTDRLVSEVYAMLYNDLYEQIREEVIGDITEERFQEIYDQIITQIYGDLDEGTLSLEAVSLAEQVLRVATDEASSIIGVSNYSSSGLLQSVGSGVIYKHVGTMYYVVTNHHVVEDDATDDGITNDPRIRLGDGTTIAATIVGYDETTDLAVLTFVTDRTLNVASFGDSSDLATGTVVLAVGNPDGYEFFGSVTMGIVSGTRRYFDTDNDGITEMYFSFIQHDASINSGNSGGALFNLDGEVIGINSIKISSSEIEGMGFAIPISLVAAVCADIELYGFSKQTPVLGVQIADIATVTPEEFAQEGITIPEGIEAGYYVIAVMSGSSVDGYVQAGDIITQIGDIVISNKTETSKDFYELYHVGDVISIVVYRNGSYITLENIELLSKTS